MSIRDTHNQQDGIPEGTTDGSTPDERELNEALARVRDLVSEGEIENARALAQQLAGRWSGSEGVQYWRRVLAPPQASVAQEKRGRPLHRERAWIRRHAREYPGCWLAVFEDRLIAAHPDLGVVLSQAHKTPEGKRALLYLQAGKPEK